MRVYFSTSALNRPLDDLSSERVRLEAEAVVGLLAAVESGRVDWVGSEYLDFEVDQDPDGERVRRVRSLLRLVSKRVEVSGTVTAAPAAWSAWASEDSTLSTWHARRRVARTC